MKVHLPDLCYCALCFVTRTAVTQLLIYSKLKLDLYVISWALILDFKKHLQKQCHIPPLTGRLLKYNSGSWLVTFTKKNNSQIFQKANIGFN